MILGIVEMIIGGAGFIVCTVVLCIILSTPIAKKSQKTPTIFTHKQAVSVINEKNTNVYNYSETDILDSYNDSQTTLLNLHEDSEKTSFTDDGTIFLDNNTEEDTRNI